MNTREFNKMNMFTSVNSVFQVGNDGIAKIKTLADAQGRFGEKLVVISGREAQYTTVAAGATAAKKNAVDALVAVAMRIVNALFVLGNNMQNEQLKAEFGLKPSDLFHMRELTLIKICCRIAEMGKQYCAELGAYGIVESDLESLAAAIISFRKAREEQQQRLAEVKSGRRMLYKEMIAADNILRNEIDPLMELIKESDPGFYNQYKAARVIKDLRARGPKSEDAEAALEPSPEKTGEPVPELAKAA
jgi:hypothetical protein